jgi:predicted aspartyl protease
MASELGINLNRAETVLVNIAGGHTIGGKVVTIKEVKVKGARVKNVKAIVLDSDQLSSEDGLLGMSYLQHFVVQLDPLKPEMVLRQRVVDEDM